MLDVVRLYETITENISLLNGERHYCTCSEIDDHLLFLCFSSRQSKLLASSFDLPAIIVNFQFASTCYTNGPFLYVVFLTVINLYPFLVFFVVFSIYVMFLLYVYTFSICSSHVVLKVYLLTYLLMFNSRLRISAVS